MLEDLELTDSDRKSKSSMAHSDCLYCFKQNIPVGKVLMDHVGAHCLDGRHVDVTKSNVCGYCGAVGSDLCNETFYKTNPQKITSWTTMGGIPVPSTMAHTVTVGSKCPHYVYRKYRAACMNAENAEVDSAAGEIVDGGEGKQKKKKKSKKKSALKKCTNVLFPCPHQGCNAVIWKYNVAYHFRTFHHASHGLLSDALTKGMEYIIQSKNPDLDDCEAFNKVLEDVGALNDQLYQILKSIYDEKADVLKGEPYMEPASTSTRQSTRKAAAKRKLDSSSEGVGEEKADRESKRQRMDGNNDYDGPDAMMEANNQAEGYI